MNYLVSVIIPVYKVEKYLDECLKSVLYQTYTNLEIILVDDGSPDSCPQKCDDYAVRDKRVKVIHKNNGGLSSARNAGLDNAIGDFVIFIDSDDFIANNTVERLLSIAIEKNLDVVGSSILKYRSGKVSKVPNSLPDGITVFNENEALRWMLLTKIDVASWNKIYRRSSIGTHRFPLGRYNEDVIFLFYLYLDGVRVGYTSESFYYYRTTPGGLTQTFNSKKFDVISNANEMEQHLINIKKNNILGEMTVYKDVWYINIMMNMIKYKVTSIYKNEFMALCSYSRKNFFRIIFGQNYNIKIRVKAILLWFSYFVLRE